MAPGSIPACAGEPAASRTRSGMPSFYPRVCGGTSLWDADTGGYRGLSPRVRGNRTCVPAPRSSNSLCSAGEPGLSPRVRGNRTREVLQGGTTRSIPACAGEPQSVYLLSPQNWVYPRVCGGTLITQEETPPVPGLSPRVRGNLSGLLDGFSGLRSIPACAGEPPVIVPVVKPPFKKVIGVYPRVCGGT